MRTPEVPFRHQQVCLSFVPVDDDPEPREIEVRDRRIQRIEGPLDELYATCQRRLPFCELERQGGPITFSAILDQSNQMRDGRSLNVAITGMSGGHSA